MDRQTSVVLTEEENAAAAQVGADHGLTLSDLVRAELGEDFAAAALRPYLPPVTERRKVRLNPRQWQQVADLLAAVKQERKQGITQADVLRALLRKAIARYQSHSASGGAPSGV